MADRFLKIGIVGCGRHGHVLIDSINRIAPALRPRIVALCDPWPLARASTLCSAKSAAPVEYADFHEFLRKTAGELDAVVIASPDYLHESQARACLEHGLHIYLEPPMAFTEDGARELVALSKEKSRLLQIGYHRRSHSSYRAALVEIPRADLFGELNIVKTHYAIPRPKREDLLANVSPALAVSARRLDELGFEDMEAFINWRGTKRCYAGYLCNEASHKIDLMNWALGKPSSAMANGISLATPSGHLDCVDSVLDYPATDGKFARAVNHLEVGHSLSGTIDFFHGTDGTVTLDERRGLAFFCPESHHYPGQLESGARFGMHFERRTRPAGMDRREYAAYIESMPRLFACVRGGTSPYDGSHYFKAPFLRPRWRAHLENFVRAIRGQLEGDFIPLHCPGEDGFLATAVCIKLQKAALSGERLSISPRDLSL